MIRGLLSQIFRKLKLLYFLDILRFKYQKIRNYKKNKKFIKQNSNIVLPPNYMMYESFQINYNKYFFDGKDTAEWLMNQFGKYKKLENLNILDWGCGPARIIRHLSELTQDCSFFGTDYNNKTIKWCNENIKNVKFSQNNLVPELSYEDNFFDLIYGISIFTHLSEEMHHKWFEELIRILKTGGILLLTTQGNDFKQKLTAKESVDFKNGKLIVRGKVKEGHRTYSAFQPESFMKKLLKSVKILDHIEGEKLSNSPEQDIWIIQKQEMNV
ncbi:MAG: class I SAM-dependent methyltransferase [Bacteroidota bacterium]|nr:class I SAM-dependent methyltransferase [Bacteroidota bacterium]